MQLLKGYFTVPGNIADERVLGKMDKYVGKYADHYDGRGWRLKSKIFSGKSTPLTEDIRAGLARWLIMAYWERQPITYNIDVKDEVIPKLLKTGKFSLN